MINEWRISRAGVNQVWNERNNNNNNNNNEKKKAESTRWKTKQQQLQKGKKGGEEFVPKSKSTSWWLKDYKYFCHCHCCCPSHKAMIISRKAAQLGSALPSNLKQFRLNQVKKQNTDGLLPLLLVSCWILSRSCLYLIDGRAWKNNYLKPSDKI